MIRAHNESLNRIFRNCRWGRRRINEIDVIHLILRDAFLKSKKSLCEEVKTLHTSSFNEVYTREKEKEKKMLAAAESFQVFNATAHA